MGRKRKKNKRQGKSHIRHKAFEDNNISSLEDHKRQGGTLTPPLAQLSQIANMVSTSWRDHAINEVLWAVILRGNLTQEECLAIFRQIIANAREADPDHKDTFISHSALSAISNEQFDFLMSPVLENAVACDLLRSLLYFECLPDRQHWQRHLPEPDPSSHSNCLMQAVSRCSDHQAQEATDIRWFKLMYCAIVQGRLIFSKDQTETTEELRLYPNYGDQRKVRPSIRALEISLRDTTEQNGHPYEIPKSLCELAPMTWSDEFWKECLDKTPCITGKFKKPDHTNNRWYYDQFLSLYQSVADHFSCNIDNTDTDARREAVYGLVLYSLFIALTIGHHGYHQRPEGRILIRTIIETFITLKYLVHKDDLTIWRQFRAYGTGKAKLSFLKNLREETIPNFIDLKDLQNYANEDIWQEYSNINLKPWSQKNLRNMADESGAKDFYDKYYDWASGYVHGNWAAIRDTVFTVCLNPLHRLHRIPLAPRLDMPSVQPDTAKILNSMLELLNQCYPQFKDRIMHPD